MAFTLTFITRTIEKEAGQNAQKNQGWSREKHMSQYDQSAWTPHVPKMQLAHCHHHNGHTNSNLKAKKAKDDAKEIQKEVVTTRVELATLALSVSSVDKY